MSDRPPRILTRVLAAIGLAPIALGAWFAFSQHHLLSTAQPVDAVILESREKVVRQKNGSRRVAVIRYHYQRDGRTFESSALTASALHLPPNAANTLASFPLGATVRAWVDPSDPSRAFLLRSHSFVPYTFAIAGAFVLAIAAGIASRGVRVHRSGTPEVADPERRDDGWFEVEPFRPYLALRRSAVAGAVTLAAILVPTFGHYAAVAESVHPGAVMAAIAAFLVVARLAWGAFTRTWAGSRLEEARLFVRPEGPKAGAPFSVRVTQPAKSAVTIDAFDVTLIGERTETRTLRGKTRSVLTIVLRERATIGESRHVVPGESHTAEHTFAVPPDAVANTGFLKWRIELRTRIAGPDYRTQFRFPIR